MRALSVRQPWAEQIASGKKKIESARAAEGHGGLEEGMPVLVRGATAAPDDVP